MEAAALGGGGAGDLEGVSSGKKGKTEKRPMETRGAAHLGRRRTERGPAADSHGGRLGQPWTAALRCLAGDGDCRRRCGSASRCS
jgi:hypothetical protein